MLLALIREVFGDTNAKLKCLEEMAELSEKLLKSITKPEELKPNSKDIIEEIGDLEIRLAVVKLIYGSHDVDARVSYKQNQIARHIEKNYGKTFPTKT